MYNQSQGNTQYNVLLLEHKWNTKCSEPVTPKTPIEYMKERVNKKQTKIKAI